MYCVLLQNSFRIEIDNPEFSEPFVVLLFFAGKKGQLDLPQWQLVASAHQLNSLKGQLWMILPTSTIVYVICLHMYISTAPSHRTCSVVATPICPTNHRLCV